MSLTILQSPDGEKHLTVTVNTCYSMSKFEQSEMRNGPNYQQTELIDPIGLQSIPSQMTSSKVPRHLPLAKRPRLQVTTDSEYPHLDRLLTPCHVHLLN